MTTFYSFRDKMYCFFVFFCVWLRLNTFCSMNSYKEKVVRGWKDSSYRLWFHAFSTWNTLLQNYGRAISYTVQLAFRSLWNYCTGALQIERSISAANGVICLQVDRRWTRIMVNMDTVMVALVKNFVRWLEYAGCINYFGTALTAL